ncbi:hypothetical protein BG015_011589 [Linnemannia schmuckeri]|uniref:Uncharacterized protein n=1 Tax=Linnemannia schmuckeri TaxID=64567 RepID=A0A9P5RST4_9FUNG|nr:hypothetical protein BG015_011589 [Linnemannia schmuckeri]
MNSNMHNTEVRHYCYQHEPRMTVDRQCLTIVRSKDRQCMMICSSSKIKSDRPIYNIHYETSAKLVPH